MKPSSELPIARVASVLTIVYLIWFLAPLLLIDIDPNATPPSGLDSIFSAGVGEVIVAAVLLVLIGFLGWWKIVGLKGRNEGGLKLIFLPLAYTMLLIALAVALAQSKGLPVIDLFDFHTLALLFLISFLVGFNEEVIFRGFVFGGLIKKLNPLWAVILCAVIFGSFHLVNLVQGQPLDTTLSQVLQAGSMGFLYAALRLRLGSIWPVIILHGFWDFSVSIMQQSAQLAGMETGVTSGFHPLAGLPVLLYGVFVFWRWKVWKSKS